MLPRFLTHGNTYLKPKDSDTIPQLNTDQYVPSYTLQTIRIHNFTQNKYTSHTQ